MEDSFGRDVVAGLWASDDEALAALVRPTRWTTVNAIENDRRVVPAAAGIYGWWFDTPPPGVPLQNAMQSDGRYWLYVGVAGGRAGSKRTLRRRITNHVRGPVRVSTLRRTLAALLSESLGLDIVRSESGKALLGPEDETRLTSWMNDHMQVTWIKHERPRVLEERLLQSEPGLPLNILGSIHPFAGELRRRRAACFRRAGPAQTSTR